MATTLNDVARAAGVSRSTASRVLAGTKRNVDPALADRVFQASAELGYRTNAVARALRTQRTRMIGVVVPSLQNAYFANVVHSLSSEISDHGGGLLVAASEDQPEVERERLLGFRDSIVESLVVVPTSRVNSGPAINEVAESLPVVQLDRYADGVEAPYVGINNRLAVQLMVTHLRSRGYERLLFLGADEESSAGGERIEAFKVYKGSGDEIRVVPSFSVEAGRAAAIEIMEHSELPGAVVCSADVLAVGVFSTLQHQGVSIPEQVAVTGFDDTQLLELMTPALTTIRPPLPVMAKATIEALADLADGASRATVPAAAQRFDPGLITRFST
ncbi:LacI family DNA-binding transcriptional regulator [Nesterenkonia muleiensis]|uniref:LacI family DNA-binding transcriptional regulator n=1 Tax=Nesterenkonia muleiensis TaxID=2282648 RepID=UPI000E716BFB|nr:LacI family DNA-binding transcriptional regulator [Nesterenkonia muleiensis]